MSSGPSFHTGRASALAILVTAVAGLTCQAAALALRPQRTLGPQAPSHRLATPLNRVKVGDLPLQRVSREEALQWQRNVVATATGQLGPAAVVPAPPETQPQFVDLTTNPRPPLVGDSTLCREIHPMWSWDQQNIFFASNNADPAGTYGKVAPAGNSPFHIYRMSSDGAFIQQITGISNTPELRGEITGNQFYPAINHSRTKLAYVHRDSPAQPFELYVYDIGTGQRRQVTGVSVDNSPIDNASLIAVERPTWAPSDGDIAFAARNKNVTNDPLNIYVVDVETLVIRKLTNGTPANGVECKDPIYHPEASTDRIVFAANTGGTGTIPVNPTTGDLNYLPTTLRDLRGDGSANDVDHNLFSIPSVGASAGNRVQQLTTATSDDIEPTYNQSLYPAGSNPTAGYFNNYLAFASLGRQGGNTYDIYFFDGNVENAGNVPLRLFTPDTNAGAVPLNGTDERYPTWSASLPPQNPIDRIVFSSNRQNNTADLAKPTISATDTDLWSSEVTDITPPTLFWMDEQKGEVMHIANAPLPNPGRRVGTPGDPFYFYARLKDLQYGVESVWVQIKDPDGPSTDNLGVNHRLYGTGSAPFNGRNPFNNTFVARSDTAQPPAATHYIHVPYETDFEGIGVSDYQYFSDPVRPDIATIAAARYASKDPGIDDSVRWSGNQPSAFNPTFTSNRPPLDAGGNNRWLRLHDDGNFPDLVAGDDVYSATWVTPLDGSDFYVDLIAYDKAFNPKNPSEQQNWIVYDNIWGFSTQPFVSRQPVLYVDDNGAGQKWPRGLKGNFRQFPTFRFGTESDIIDRPSAFQPREVPLAGGSLINIVDPGINGVIGRDGSFQSVQNETFDFLIGDSIGYDFIDYSLSVGGERFEKQSYRYDLWRILAKGPLTETAINNYVPTVDDQPGDISGDPALIIHRPVPRRAVCWSAPYTGDIFAGGGTILDQATHTLLRTYKARHGRMVIGGGDILWALTGDGATPHQFATDVLGASYVSDVANNRNANYNNFLGGPLGLNITRDVRRSFPPRGDPPYWGPFYDPEPLGSATDKGGMIRGGFANAVADGFYGGNPFISAIGGNGAFTVSSDGTPFEVADRITPVAGWEEVFADRVVANDDAATSSKTVFFSMSLASIGRRYVAQDNDNLLYRLNCMNYRAKISHAMFCWMFSADLVGQIKNLNGGAPISGAWVQAFQGNTLVGSAFSRSDGTYTIRGLPVGNWSIAVTNPGFLAFNKADASNAHGLEQPQLDVLLTPAAPGSISGSTLDVDGQPVPGVQVHATLRANALYTGNRDFFATSRADGTYVIPSAPVGQYDVTLDTPLPTGFTTFTPQFTAPVTVNQSQPTSNIDFELQGGPSDLTINVFRQQPDGTKGAALPGVEITLLDSLGAVITGMTGLTNSQGAVTFTAVPAGLVTVSAYKQGFQEASTIVSVPQQQTPVEILLVPASAQSVYGRAVRAVDNAPLGLADLTPAVSLQLLRKVSQLPIGSTTDVFSPPLTTPQVHNYRFDTFEGSYTVALQNHPRFFDASVDVTVTASTPSFAPVLQLIGRQGVLSGQVNETSGAAAGAPIAGASVQIIAQTGANAGQTAATLLTGSDGRWTTAGSLPSNLYTLQISKFGYSSKTVTDVFLAGDTDTGQVLLIKAPRGQVYGLARRAGDGTPRPNVTVQFWTLPTSPYGSFKVSETVSAATTFTGLDGLPANYTIGATAASAEFLPEGDYQVRVTGDTRFAAFTGQVTVIGGQSTRFNVDLTPLGGILTGLVKEDILTGTGTVAGPPVPGATVKVMLGNATVATLVTDSNGQYQTNGAIAPANYTVVATAFGFQQNSVQVFVEGPTSPPTTPDVLLERLPPSTLNGAITRKGITPIEYVPDVTVDLLSTVDGSVVTSTSSTSASGTINYTLTDVPAGTYILRATKSGWKSAQTASFTVSPNTTVRKDLAIEPQYTFGQGLLLISLPDDFPGQDAAAVLGVNSADFKAAYWVTGRQEYAYYDRGDAEAREFRLGKAMFVRFSSPTAFTKAGAVAPNAPFSIPVQSGWNLIGSVRRQRIEWLRVKVATPDGNLRTMQEAMDAGVVGNGLYSFVDRYFRTDFMDPFVGYFMKANQDCTLIVPVDNRSTQTTSRNRTKVAAKPAPSIQQVAAEIAAAGLGPKLEEPAIPVWAAMSNSHLLRDRNMMPSRTKSTNNPFELWPWRPGLG